MRATAYLQEVIAFLPGQLWLALCIGVLVALAVALVVVSIVFGGNRGTGPQASTGEGETLQDATRGPG